MKYTLIDLFPGVGELSLGLKFSKFNFLFSLDLQRITN